MDGVCYPCHGCPALFVSLAGREKHIKRMHPPNHEGHSTSYGYSCPFEPCASSGDLFQK